VTHYSHVIGHLLHCIHCVACVRLETALNTGCELREDVEWSKCRSNNVRVERHDGILSRLTGHISRPFK